MVSFHPRIVPAAQSSAYDPENSLSAEELFKEAEKLYNSKVYKKAASYFASAAQKGHIGAKYYLAAMYIQGEGLDRNEYLGFVLLNEAADKGHSEAQHILGTMYEWGCEGCGVPIDLEQAMSYYIKAAEQLEEDALTDVLKLHVKMQNS